MSIGLSDLRNDAVLEVRQLLDKELNRLFPKRLIRRVLLIAPPDVDVDMFDYATAKRGRCWNYAPYGLGIIASHLRNDNLEVRIINLNSEVLKAGRLSSSKEQFDFNKVCENILTESVGDFQPDIAGVTCMFTQTHKSCVNVCNELRRISPELPIAVGGVHITNCFLENKTSDLLVKDFNNADMFFLYEAELAFKQFIKVVNQTARENELYQVCFNVDHQNLYFSKKMIPQDKDLDIIPAHDLMRPQELSRYGAIGSFFCFKEKEAKIATVLSNRGCRGQCTYCSVRNFNGQGVRHRSIESVVDELSILKDKYGIDHVMWLDDDLLHDDKRVLKLFDEMTKRDLRLTWDCTNGVIASSCTDNIIAAAAKSGCIGLTIGVESGNPDMLKKIKKPGNADTYIKAATVLRKYEQIVSRVFLMIGFPNETYSMIYDTFNLAMKMGLDWYNITIFEPLPNTSLFDSMRKDGALYDFEFENIRYNAGPYGKLQENLNRNIFISDIENPFNDIDLGAVPPKSALGDIWFSMNYNLNFKRLYSENRPVKLKQHLKYLQTITDLIAPGDPFPMYFCGYLQNKVLGKIDARLIERLEQCFCSSRDWRDKFENCNLSINHLKTGNFPGETRN